MSDDIYTNLGKNGDTPRWWINFNNKHQHDCELEHLAERYFEIFQNNNATPLIDNHVLVGLHFNSSFSKLMFLLKYG